MTVHTAPIREAILNLQRLQYDPAVTHNAIHRIGPQIKSVVKRDAGGEFNEIMYEGLIAFVATAAAEGLRRNQEKVNFEITGSEGDADALAVLLEQYEGGEPSAELIEAYSVLYADLAVSIAQIFMADPDIAQLLKSRGMHF